MGAEPALENGWGEALTSLPIEKTIEGKKMTKLKSFSQPWVFVILPQRRIEQGTK